MSYNYAVGEKVVCVDDKFDAVARKLYEQFPKYGLTYVVRDMGLGIATDCKTGEVCVLLVGVVNPKNKRGRENGFAGWRFAPLEEWVAWQRALKDKGEGLTAEDEAALEKSRFELFRKIKEIVGV